ncbi:DUF885 domain-containing protein [Bogoriella caseilytica]|uniref:Uncharacterized protein (DUF885 family) n=1 Tax=Bogoriella caseilytica TaxID=56055 RepID=A0A3N2BA98_9MICO|nr:DUF885 domain-containing protein [Bogoriella caseilytica]ROR72199.1 uncharacterized protein (DUF885 family) [Bogoriella caseilytica]
MTDRSTPRQLADAYVHELAALDPSVATGLGLNPADDRMPDFSPAGHEARNELARTVLQELDELEAASGEFDALEQRCATLLRDRLGVQLEAADAGEHLRPLRNIASPIHGARSIFLMMPAATAEDWGVIARRMAQFPQAYASLTEALEEGRRRGLLSAPLQVETVAGQIGEWIGSGEAGATSWFHDFVTRGAEIAPELREDLHAAADAAAAAVAGMQTYLRETYLPAAHGTPDAVGRERYLLGARRVMGSAIDPEEVYAWGWAEYQRLNAEMQQLAEKIRPGSTPVEVMRWLDENGRSVEGEQEVQRWLQDMMDGAIEELDGTHFDIAEPIKQVEAMIAPAGSAAAPYYTRPSVDFSRPGRTWLPTLGRTSFPVYDLVSTWYHEGVPGHHLQLAQWAYVAPQLSIYQTTLGSSSGATEGWALYAERLMDELGYLDDEERMGYLDAQMMRAVRVVIDIGMHLQFEIPDDSPLAPGQQWTPQLAGDFFKAHSGRPHDFIDSEIVRYLGWPGQAISYKLGERSWLAGREAARQAHAARGEELDLKSWHMAALSLGALGLDDLERELAQL